MSRLSNTDPRWKIRGYSNARCKGGGGQVLVETTHRTESSAQLEASVWIGRAQNVRDHVSHCIVWDLKTGWWRMFNSQSDGNMAHIQVKPSKESA